MKSVLTFLALCHRTWPTPEGKHHNITLADDGKRLCISIWHEEQWWSYYLFEDALVEPAELVGRINLVLGSQSKK